MNGIYIHVPFCAHRCVYCGFYSTTYGASVREEYVEALCHELHLRRGYLPVGDIDTLYIGGGTPSQLTLGQFDRIFSQIRQDFTLNPQAEVTVEVNPDDVTPDLVAGLRGLGVNRLSMGIQTLDDDLLRLLRRRHTAREALHAVEVIVSGGIPSLSVDLIYGLPRQSLEKWTDDVERVLRLPIQHLSAYCLMYEEGTPLYKMKERGEVAEADDELERQMYERLLDMTAAAGMEHYEISNFCRPGCRARHNSGYWQEMRYLGCGPGAHSYDGRSRRWNNGDVLAYIKAGGDTSRSGLSEGELLTESDLLDEMVMKSLRTCEGIDLRQFRQRFGETATDALMDRARPFVAQGVLRLDKGRERLVLSREGLFVSDMIMSGLMAVDD